MHKASNLWNKMSVHLYSTDLVFKQTFEKKLRRRDSKNFFCKYYLMQQVRNRSAKPISSLDQK